METNVSDPSGKCGLGIKGFFPFRGCQRLPQVTSGPKGALKPWGGVEQATFKERKKSLAGDIISLFGHNFPQVDFGHCASIFSLTGQSPFWDLKQGK